MTNEYKADAHEPVADYKCPYCGKWVAPAIEDDEGSYYCPECGASV